MLPDADGNRLSASRASWARCSEASGPFLAVEYLVTCSGGNSHDVHSPERRIVILTGYPGLQKSSPFQAPHG